MAPPRGALPSAEPAPGSCPLPVPLDRDHALRVLELSSADDEGAVKRAYRRLARAHHPDVGGEVAVFHELQRAYETLVGDGSPAPVVRPPGRPSRAREDWDAHRTGAPPRPLDLDRVDWDAPLPEGPEQLSLELAARWLAAGSDAAGSDAAGAGSAAGGTAGGAAAGGAAAGGAAAGGAAAGGVTVVRPLVAASRAPGSRLNRVAPRLSGDLTATLEVTTARDDRGRPVLAIVVRAGNRRARRALDAVGLAGGWARRRGSASTTLRRTLPLDVDARTTALHASSVLEELLDRMAWGFEAWTLTSAAG